MFVWINSMYTLFTSSMFVVCVLDKMYGIDKPGTLVKLINSPNVTKYFCWGIFE